MCKKFLSLTEEILTPCGKVYVHFLLQEGRLSKVMARLGKSGGCPAAIVEGVCNTISVAIGAGADITDLIRGLEGISCRRMPALDQGAKVFSCVDGIAKALKGHLERGALEEPGYSVSI